MSLKDQLTEDMKQAMKDKEAGKVRLSTIRMVRSSIKNLEIDQKRELSDEDVLAVLTKEVKLRRDAREEFSRAGREDLVANLEAELEVLVKYLPEPLTDAEIREIVTAAVAQAMASGQIGIGPVMSLVMPQVKGKADGKIVNAIVRELVK